MTPHAVAATSLMTSATSSVGPLPGSDTDSCDESLETNTRMSPHDGPHAGSPRNTTEILSDAALQTSSRESPSHDSQPDVLCDNETGEASHTAVMSPRAYQLEMLDQSLNKNAVVVVRSQLYMKLFHRFFLFQVLF